MWLRGPNRRGIGGKGISSGGKRAWKQGNQEQAAPCLEECAQATRGKKECSGLKKAACEKKIKEQGEGWVSSA